MEVVLNCFFLAVGNEILLFDYGSFYVQLGVTFIMLFDIYSKKEKPHIVRGFP